MADYSIQYILGASTVNARSLKYTPPSPATTWTITHGFGTKNLIVEFYDQNNLKIIPNSVTVTTTTVTVTWQNNQTGTAIVLAADDPNVFVYTQTTPSLLWNINHNKGDANVLYQFYDNTGKVFIPDSITQYNSNTLGATFVTPASGTAVVFAVDIRYINIPTCVYTRETASDTWFIPHNQNTTTPIVYVYDGAGKRVIPTSIDASDPSTVKIIFANATVGTAYVVGIYTDVATGTTGSGIDTRPASYKSFLYHNTGAAATFTFTHGLNEEKPFVQVYDAVNNLIIPDRIFAQDANTLSISLLTPQDVFVRVVSVQGPASYNFYQSVSSQIWQINHGLNVDYPIVALYDSGNNIIIPDSIVSNGFNTATITFKTPQAGYAKVVNVPTNISNLRPFRFVESANNTLWNINHGLSDQYPIIQFYDSQSSQFIPNTAFAFTANEVDLGLLVPDTGVVRLLATPSGTQAASILFDPRDPRVQAQFRSIVPFVAEEFPAIVRGFQDTSTSSGQNIIVTFMEAYYEWLEREISETSIDTNIQYLINNSDLLFDLDYGVKKYLSHYKFEYLNQIPYLFSNDPSIQISQASLNPATLIKLIRQFYKTKGTQKAIRFLFNFLFNDPSATIQLASPRLLTDPNVLQTQVSYIRTPFNTYLSQNDNYKNLLGRYLFGEISNAQIKVENLSVIQEGPYPVLEIEVSHLIGTLQLNEYITTRDSLAQIRFVPYVVCGDYTINNAGLSYVPNTVLTVTNPGTFYNFSAIVDTVSPTGAITAISIVDPGINTSSGSSTAPTVSLASSGNGAASVTILKTVVFQKVAPFARYNGAAEDVPTQQLIPIFTSYQSRYSNLTNGTVPYTKTAQIKDYGPNNANGVVIGSVTFQASTTGFGQRVVFDGTWNDVNTNGIDFGTNQVLCVTTPWTIDARIKATSLPNREQTILGRWASRFLDSHYRLYLTSANKLAVDAVALGGTTVTVVAPSAITTADTHIAAEWNGTQLTLFINGVVVGSASLAAMQVSSESGSFWIGRDDQIPDVTGQTTPNPFAGAVEEVRISNRARYNATNFTVPVAPYTNDANTVLLVHLDALDNTLNNTNTTVVLSAPVEFTYYIRSQVPIAVYRDILKNTVHPAGMKFYGIVDVSFGENVYDQLLLDFFHTVHPSDANYSNPRYTSTRFFQEIRPKLEWNVTRMITDVSFEDNIKTDVPVASQRLGMVVPLGHFDPYKIDLYTTQTFPVGNQQSLPLVNSPDTNSPDRNGSSSFGHYTTAQFYSFSNAAFYQKTNKDPTPITFTNVFNSATAPIYVDGLGINASNLTVPSPSGKVRTTTSKTTGKFYAEFMVRGIPTVAFQDLGIGVGIVGSADPASTIIGTEADSYGFYLPGFFKFNNGVMTQMTSDGVGALYSVIRVAIDFTSGKIFFGVNHDWLDNADPVAGTNPAFTFTPGTFYLAMTPNQQNTTVTALLNQDSQFYSLPTGYSAYDTINTRVHPGITANIFPPVPTSGGMTGGGGGGTAPIAISFSPSSLTSSFNTTGSTTVTGTSSTTYSISGGTPPYTKSLTRVTNNTPSGSGITGTVGPTLLTFTSSEPANTTDDRIATFRLTVTDSLGNMAYNDIVVEQKYVVTPVSINVSPPSDYKATPTTGSLSSIFTVTTANGTTPRTISVVKIAGGPLGMFTVNNPTPTASPATVTIDSTGSFQDRIATFRFTVTDNNGVTAYQDVVVEHQYGTL